jgi:hypothetical protein
MQASGRIALLLGFTAGWVGGCLNIGAYTCSDSTQCTRDGEPGYCQPTGYCSYQDPTCPVTGFRYGDEAEDGLAGECVMLTGATDTDIGPTTMTPGGSESSTGSSTTDAPTTLDPSTTAPTTDGTSSETGDTCGALDQPCCGADVCDDGLSCYGGTCGCVADIAAGNNHTCITRADGSVMCWGANDTGQLGVPALASSPTPILTAETLLGPGMAATSIDAAAHTCALREDGNAVCWGENATGASVPGLPSKTPSAPTAITLATNWTQPALGTGFSCIARSAEFLATCFGSNNRGQLTGVETPGPVNIEALFSFAEIDASASHVCGRTATGDMYCWGENSDGQLGVSPMTVPFSATVRQILLGGIADIAVGARHSCGRVGNTVRCWGNNSLGQLGDGTTTASLTNVTAILPDAPIADVAAHGSVTCAKYGSGEVYCWGDNTGDKLQASAELAGAAFASTPLLFDPIDELSMPIAIDKAVFGDGHACVLSDTHALYCWGLNAQGQVGNGLVTAQVIAPTRIDISCG